MFKRVSESFFHDMYFLLGPDPRKGGTPDKKDKARKAAALPIWSGIKLMAIGGV